MRFLAVLVVVFFVVALYLGWFRFHTHRQSPDDGKLTIGVEVDTQRFWSDTEAARDRVRNAGQTVPAVAPKTETTRGMLKSLDEERSEFGLVDAVDRSWTFYLTKMTRVYLNDREVGLSDLRPGDLATVTYEPRDGNNLLAVEVRCKR